MRRPLLVLLLLSLVLTVKAQQDDKPASAQLATYQNTNEETAALPPGGMDVFMKYVKKNANREYNNADTGKVTLSFVVEKDGSLAGYKIIKSLNKEADGVAIEVLQEYDKKWKPAMQNGQPATALYTIVVPFGE
jgi:protein TonB